MGKGQRIDIKSFRNGFENHPVSIAVSAYKVEDDRMIFTKGDVTGAFVDADGNEMSSEESQKLVKPARAAALRRAGIPRLQGRKRFLRRQQTLFLSGEPRSFLSLLD